MEQIRLDLRNRITTGKKTQRLAIPCSEEFLEMLDRQAVKLNTTRAELAYRYVLNGMKETLGEIFLVELHGDKRLSELL